MVSLATSRVVGRIWNFLALSPQQHRDDQRHSPEVDHIGHKMILNVSDAQLERNFMADTKGQQKSFSLLPLSE